jgi:hypothetical protein
MAQSLSRVIFVRPYTDLENVSARLLQYCMFVTLYSMTVDCTRIIVTLLYVVHQHMSCICVCVCVYFRWHVDVHGRRQRSNDIQVQFDKCYVHT